MKASTSGPTTDAPVRKASSSTVSGRLVLAQKREIERGKLRLRASTPTREGEHEQDGQASPSARRCRVVPAVTSPTASTAGHA